MTDPSEYGRLVQERQRLDGETKRLESLQRQHDDLREQMQEQGRGVLAACRAVSRVRQDFLGQALLHNSFVRISLLPYGRGPAAVERSLRALLGVAKDK